MEEEKVTYVDEDLSIVKVAGTTGITDDRFLMTYLDPNDFDASFDDFARAVERRRNRSFLHRD
ncbi:MAG: hypothetical protein H0V97_02985 [Actinobacteria bacterium]|nr:hypothetical protein [Actinomycetota bacterium]